MSGEKGNIFPIRRKDFEEHFKKVDEAMSSINRGTSERFSLFDLVKGVGSGTKDLMDESVQKITHVYRDGFALYYQIDAMVGDRAKKVDGVVTDQERNYFSHSYATFASSSWMEHRLGLLMGNREAIPVDTGKTDFDYGLQRDILLNMILGKLYGLINSGIREKRYDEGIDLSRDSVNFFKFVKEHALSKKSTINHSLIELVDKSSFVIDNDYTLSGFESSFEEKSKPKIEFERVEPHEIIGCTDAKREMFRDMDRLSLYDVLLKKNPIMVVGGLTPSVLYDGFPGTGKTTLFRGGRTRLLRRLEALEDFWKSKNTKLAAKFLEISPQVKTKWYGEAGQNVANILQEASRPDFINLLLLDDIDLLFSGGREESGGGDKDIMNNVMQFLSGANTKFIGNNQIHAATNEPTALEAALRQRFYSKYEVAGPESADDFSDLIYLKLGKWINNGIISVDLGKDFVPLKDRKFNTSYDAPGEKESILTRVTKRFSSALSLQDLGKMARGFKDENPRFTGRPIHGVAEAVTKRINDYDIPEEWFTEPSRFFEKSFDERVNMLKEMCKKIDSTVIAEELEKNARIEGRYVGEKFEKDVEKTLNIMKVNNEATRRIIAKNTEGKK